MCVYLKKITELTSLKRPTVTLRLPPVFQLPPHGKTYTRTQEDASESILPWCPGSGCESWGRDQVRGRLSLLLFPLLLLAALPEVRQRLCTTMPQNSIITPTSAQAGIPLSTGAHRVLPIISQREKELPASLSCPQTRPSTRRPRQVGRAQGSTRRREAHYSHRFLPPSGSAPRCTTPGGKKKKKKPNSRTALVVKQINSR